MGDLWLPGVAGPQDDFVARLHRRIERFAEAHGVDQAVVEIELRDGSRFVLDSITAEPGYGFVTLVPHPDEEEDLPGEVIIPVGAIDRLELYSEADRPQRFGFSLPAPDAGSEG